VTDDAARARFLGAAVGHDVVWYCRRAVAGERRTPWQDSAFRNWFSSGSPRSSSSACSRSCVARGIRSRCSARSSHEVRHCLSDEARILPSPAGGTSNARSNTR
jgi:hypothetical protein